MRHAIRRRGQAGPKATERRATAAGTVPPAKKPSEARFPYRKVEDLEAEIAAGRGALREVEGLLASPDLYRDGDRVKETTRVRGDQARLQQLYEHWEEAVELN